MHACLIQVAGFIEVATETGFLHEIWDVIESVYLLLLYFSYS